MEIFKDNGYKCIYISSKNISRMIVKIGKKKAIEKILNTINKERVSFPYKRIFIKDVDTLFNKILNLGDKWLNEKYTLNDQERLTPNLVSTSKYSTKFSRPVIKNGKIEFEKPRYYLYDYKEKDYDYDIITDYYIEKSRIKSFRPAKFNKDTSPYDAWINNTMNYKENAINKIMNNRDDLDMFNLREALYSDRNIKEVSHEKVTFLSALIKLLDYKGTKIFDCCAGWGDRFLASFVVNAEMYIGVEPNDDSVSCFKEIQDKYTDEPNKHRVMHDSMPNAEIPFGNFDIVFLSPPSFSSENYGEADRQSTVMFPKRTEWTFEFLFKTIDRCWTLLSEGGMLVVQSILITEINSYIYYKFSDAKYLGCVSVKCSSQRNKPLWIFLKSNLIPPIKQNNSTVLNFNPIIRDILDKKETFGLLVPEFLAELPNAIVWNKDKNYDYSKIIIFKTHDYYYNYKKFLSVIDKIGDRLINHVNLIKWNIEKSYLEELSDIVTIPFSIYTNELLLSLFKNIKSKKIVIKPLIGASSHNIIVVDKPTDKKSLFEVGDLMYEVLKYPYEEEQEFIIQPYYSGIQKGEISVVFFHDGFHHAIIKFINSKDLFHTHLNRIVEAYKPDKELLSLCENIIKRAEEINKQRICYARLDFIIEKKEYILMELELIEPNLFFNNDNEQLNIMIEKVKTFV